MDTNGNDNASGSGSSLGGGVDLAKSPAAGGGGVELGKRGLPKLREIIIRNREDSEVSRAAVHGSAPGAVRLHVRTDCSLVAQNRSGLLLDWWEEAVLMVRGVESVSRNLRACAT